MISRPEVMKNLSGSTDRSHLVNWMPSSQTLSMDLTSVLILTPVGIEKCHNSALMLTVRLQSGDKLFKDLPLTGRHIWQLIIISKM